MRASCGCEYGRALPAAALGQEMISRMDMLRADADTIRHATLRDSEDGRNAYGSSGDSACVEPFLSA
jgi:hypothetical protein